MEHALFSEKLVKLNLSGSTKDQIIHEMVEVLWKDGRLSDKEQFTKDVYAREAEITTDLEIGAAMPHAKSKAVCQPSVAIGISQKGIIFGESKEKSYVFFMVAMPEDAAKEHIEVLGKVTSVLLEEENITALKNAKTEEDVLQLFYQEKKEVINNHSDVLLLGATGCTSGVAHTYLAAKALQKAAGEQGVQIKVETNGSIGVENSPTAEEIGKAECIIIASDRAVEMSRFDGKRIIYSKVKDGINKADDLIEKALNGEGEIYHHNGGESNSRTGQKREGSIYTALMNGVSYMLPFVIVGGIMTALAFAFGGQVTDTGLVIPDGSFWKKIADLGSAGMTLMTPILAGYIAYAIGDKVALAPGLLGGWVAVNGSFYGSESGTGFLGAIVAGFLAGYVVKAMKKIKFPEAIQSLVPLIIIPIASSLIVSFAFIFVIGVPISSMMTAMSDMLSGLNGGSLIILGIVMGFMQGFDFGGPVGKTLFMFSIGMMAQGQFEFIGAEAMAIPVAPIGMAIATFMDRRSRFFNEEEKASGKAALVMGFCGVSEGAIPFAAADPLAVIPASMIGSAVASTMGLLFSITNAIAWGGPIVVVLGLTNHPLPALICMLTGSVVTALVYYSIKTVRRKK